MNELTFGIWVCDGWLRDASGGLFFTASLDVAIAMREICGAGQIRSFNKSPCMIVFNTVEDAKAHAATMAPIT